MATNEVDPALDHALALAPPRIRAAVRSHLAGLTEDRRVRIRRWLEAGPVAWQVPDHEPEGACDLLTRVRDTTGAWMEVWIVVVPDGDTPAAWMATRDATTPIDLRPFRPEGAS